MTSHEHAAQEDEPASQWASSSRRFEALVEHASDLLVVARPDGHITYLTPPTRDFVGDRGASSAFVLADLIHPDDVRGVVRAWIDVLREPGSVVEVRGRLRRADGRLRVLAATFTNLEHHPDVRGIVVNAHDVTDELALRARFEDHLVRDGLTGLANRPALLDDLRHRCAADEPLALVLLDVVGMAALNDRIGHLAGDLLLRSVAGRLAELAPADALVARTSGDEFAVVVPGPCNPSRAEALGAELATAALAPVEVPGGGTVSCRLRVGVACSEQSDGTPGGILADADLALSDAGRGAVVRVCDDGLRQRRRRRLTIDHDLHAPDLADQLELHHQPILDLRTGRPRGVEALVRWHHPELGMVRPDEFIPVAERSGVIVELGRWVLQQACRQLATWDREGLTGLCMAVNVSARQLVDTELPTAVAAALAASDLAPSRLCLEITETALADESEVTQRTVQQLVELGVRIHVDDFGTGYSSFSQLTRFTFHGLKIDRSFVDRLGQDATSEVVVAGMLAIARSLGLHVTAEGVETEAQRRALTALGCDTAQGYLWARPVPASEVAALVRTWDAGAAQVPSGPHADRVRVGRR